MPKLRWSILKRISNSSYARLTILVPILGWLLIANDEVAKLIARVFDQSTIAQPSWKIYALHAGLSIFGVGIGFFYLLCPYPINLFNSFTDFAGTDRKTVTSEQIKVYQDALARAGNATTTQGVANSLVAPQVSSQDGRELWLRRNEDFILNTQYRFYEMNDTKWIVGQILVILLVVPGGILTFIPSVITIYQSFAKLYALTIG